jgi:hypothetical protein
MPRRDKFHRALPCSRSRRKTLARGPMNRTSWMCSLTPTGQTGHIQNCMCHPCLARKTAMFGKRVYWLSPGAFLRNSRRIESAVTPSLVVAPDGSPTSEWRVILSDCLIVSGLVSRHCGGRVSRQLVCRGEAQFPIWQLEVDAAHAQVERGIDEVRQRKTCSPLAMSSGGRAQGGPHLTKAYREVRRRASAKRDLWLQKNS